MSQASYRVLLIKPRWYLMKVLEAECVKLRDTHPGVQISVLADEKVNDENIIFVPMPDIRKDNKLSLLRFTKKFRMQTYDEIVALADDARSEAGYLEAKIWAFAARGRIRRLGSIRHLYLLEEIKDKWRRIVVQKTVVSFIRLYHKMDLYFYPSKRKLADLYDNGENRAEKRLNAFISNNSSVTTQLLISKAEKGE